MQIVYTGPHTDGVVIAATGQHALPDKPVDVPDELAERLLEQDTWEQPAGKRGRASSSTTEQAADGQED